MSHTITKEIFRDNPYLKCNGVVYHIDTPHKVIHTLNSAMMENLRVIVHYGDSSPVKYWGDTETGYIGRTTGPLKAPILVYNSRSMGGGIILTNKILKIQASKGKKVLYEQF